MNNVKISSTTQRDQEMVFLLDMDMTTDASGSKSTLKHESSILPRAMLGHGQNSTIVIYSTNVNEHNHLL